MKQVIPLSKQSKKAQREHHKKQRGSWYGLSPVTRTVASGKAYNRNKMKRAVSQMTRDTALLYSYNNWFLTFRDVCVDSWVGVSEPAGIWLRFGGPG